MDSLLFLALTVLAMYCRRSYCKCIVKELFHLTLTPTASSRNQGQGFGRAAFYTEQVFDSFVLEEKGDIADSGIFLLAFYCVLDTASRITFFNSLLSFFYKMCSSILLLGNTSHEVSLCVFKVFPVPWHLWVVNVFASSGTLFTYTSPWTFASVSIVTGLQLHASSNKIHRTGALRQRSRDPGWQGSVHFS